MENIKLLEASLRQIDEVSKDIRKFVNQLVDESSFVETSTFLSEKSIFEKSTSLSEGVLTGYAAIEGVPAYMIAQNSAVLSGSLGLAQAKKIIKCMDSAINNGHALVSILDSSGARVGEGVGCLESFAMVLAKAAEVRASVPHIVVAKGNAIGHFAAYLSLADFVFASSDAVTSFNSPSVLTANVNQQGKDIFGKDTHIKASGLFNFDYSDAKDLREKISKLLDYTDAQVLDTNDNPNRESSELEGSTQPQFLLSALADNGESIEYSTGYAPEAKCYFAKINGIATGILVTDKESNEYLTLKGVEKVANFVRLLEAYELPLVTLVDSKGLSTTIEEEQNNASQCVGRLFGILAETFIPKIGIAVGNAVGLAYTALLSKGIGFDYTLAFPQAVISPINSDTAVSLIYSKELAKKGNSPELREKLEDIYKKENSNPFIAASAGFVDEIIHPSTLRPYVANALIMLLGL